MSNNHPEKIQFIQSIPSKKAEPFKLWLAEVANQRLDQLQAPELSIEQAMLDYKLDAVISMGYRVNSEQATQFRIWATPLIKADIIKGFAMDDERLKWEAGTSKNWSALKIPNYCSF